MSNHRHFSDRPNAQTNHQASWSSWPLLSLVTFSLGMMIGPSLPSQADEIYQQKTNLYRVCTTDLIKVGISTEKSAASCAIALQPRHLSRCVRNINQKAKIAATDALLSCTHVRRPLELAECVSDIRSNTKGGEPLSILDHCRRSLLPLRFSECVVGISRGLKNSAPTEKIMNTCLDARDQTSSNIFSN